MLEALRAASSSVARSAEEMRQGSSVVGGGARVKVGGVPSLGAVSGAAQRGEHQRATGGTKAGPSAASKPLPPGMIQATVSPVTYAHRTVRPCRMYIDIALKTPQKVAALSFLNSFAASISIQQRISKGVGEWFWEKLLTEQRLMPNPHFIDGAQSRFVVSFDQPRFSCSSIRVYLTQPSPCWSIEEVRLEEVAIFDGNADLDGMRQATQQSGRPTADSRDPMVVPQPGKGLAQVGKREETAKALHFLGDGSDAVQPSDHVAAMTAICLEMCDLLQDWQADGPHTELSAQQATAARAAAAVVGSADETGEVQSLRSSSFR